MLERIGAENYDQVDDIYNIKLKIEETMLAQKIAWKNVDDGFLKYQIKKQLVLELSNIEERKQVRREQAEIVRKKKLQAEI